MHHDPPTHVRSLEQFVTDQSTDGHGAPWYALCPTLSGVITLTRTLAAAPTPDIRVLGDGTALRKASQRFPVGARLGEVTADAGPRAVAARSFPTTLVGPTATAALVTMRDARCVSIADDTRHDRLRAGAERAWADADDTDVSLPSLDAILATAERTLGSGFHEELTTGIRVADGRSPDSRSSDGQSSDSRSSDSQSSDSQSSDGVVDGVGVVLLAAAAHELLFRDVSQWTASQRLASKATCSRRRDELADAGVVTTTTVASQPGRPVLRCHLTDAARRRYDSGGLRPLIEDHCL